MWWKIDMFFFLKKYKLNDIKWGGENLKWSHEKWEKIQGLGGRNGFWGIRRGLRESQMDMRVL